MHRSANSQQLRYKFSKPPACEIADSAKIKEESVRVQSVSSLCSKRAQYEDRVLDLFAAVENLREKNVPPHLRRHNQKLVGMLTEFLKT